MRITNAGGPGAETVANGIQVVQAINGGTTAPGAFTLAVARCAAAPSTIVSSVVASAAAIPTTGSCARPSSSDRSMPLEPAARADRAGRCRPIRRRSRCRRVSIPIIGPEIATYGVVQPIARQLGMTTLGTLHERIGDTSLVANTGTPCPADGDTPDGICARRR